MTDKEPGARQDDLLRLLSGEDKRVRARLARSGLRVITPLYDAGVGLYRWLFDAGLLRREILPCPVVSIGNLTVGGTGKTSLALFLAKRLVDLGWKPALLSYGYRASVGSGPFIAGDGTHLLLSPEEAGDEAALLSESLPGVPVLIGRRRTESGALAISTFNPDVLLLDDGFQYWRLHRDVDIVLLNALEPWGYGALLPRGLLRERPSALGRASAIVVTNTRSAGPSDLSSIIDRAGSLAPRVPIFQADYEPRHLQRVPGDEVASLDRLMGARVAVLCGLGSPDSFEAILRRSGAGSLMPFHFPDHHIYRQREIDEVIAKASREGVDFVVTTTKDAVKLRRLKIPSDPPPIFAMEAEFAVRPSAPFTRWLHECLVEATRQGKDLRFPPPINAD